MDLQVLILDYILTERAGMILLLVATIFFVLQQNKTLTAIENELLHVKSKINKLVNRTDDTTSDISSLSSRISNLSGAVSEANTVAEGTKKELSMLAEGHQLGLYSFNPDIRKKLFSLRKGDSISGVGHLSRYRGQWQFLIEEEDWIK